MNKTSFIIYEDWYNVLKTMSDDVRLEVLDAMCMYAFGGLVPQDMSPIAFGAFSMIRVQMDNNKEKFDGVREKRRAAINARWNKEKQKIHTNTNEYKCINCNTNETINENVNVNENDNVLPPIVGNDNIKSSSTGDARARDKFFLWVKESDLAEWAEMRISGTGNNLEFCLAEFYDNDFSVREKTERNERGEVLKHFQSWLPKYLLKIKRDGNNENNNLHGCAANKGMSNNPDRFAQADDFDWSTVG